MHIIFDRKKKKKEKKKEFLLTKLPNLPDKCNSKSVINYYSSFTIIDDFCLNKNSENKVLKKF